MASPRTVSAACFAALCCLLVPIGTASGVEQEITGTDSTTKTYLNSGFHIHDYTATATADVTVESQEAAVRLNGPISIEQGAAFRIRIVEQTGSNQPPTVAVTTPADGSVFPEGEAILLVATASDADGTVTGVGFEFGGGAIGDAQDNGDGTWSLLWQDPPEGSHQVSATATDDGGAETISDTIDLEVQYSGSVGFVAIEQVLDLDAQDVSLTLDLSPAPGVDLDLTLTDSEGDQQVVTVPAGSLTYPLVWPAPVPEDPSDRPDLLIEVAPPPSGSVDAVRAAHRVKYAPPEALVAAADAYLLPNLPGDPYTVTSAQGVLANDFYKGPENLSAVLLSGPSGVDSFVLNADGSFTYDPVDGIVGPAVFTYKAVAGALETPEIEVNLLVEATDLQTPESNDGDGFQVSPWSFVIEGNAGDLKDATITLNGVAVPPSEILEDRFFHRDIPLSTDPAPFLVRVKRDGETLLKEDYFINWAVTEVAEGGVIDLRVGDSLRARAPATVEVTPPGGVPDPRQVDTEGLLEVLFDQPGTYTLKALDSNGQQRGTTLTVVAYGRQFAAEPLLKGEPETTISRPLTNGSVPEALTVRALDAGHLGVETFEGELTVDLFERGRHFILTRIFSTGSVISIDDVQVGEDPVTVIAATDNSSFSDGNFIASLEFPAEYEGYTVEVNGTGLDENGKALPGFEWGQFGP